MKKRTRRSWWVLLITVLATLTQMTGSREATASEKLTLARAVMCESIKGYEPVNSAVVFSIQLGRLSCFTAFDSVPKQTYIHHKWYRKDNLITDKRLTINPPSWSSFTSVQLRDADKGPWRVEITDDNGRIMRILRFSITD
jgi:hypothetical protein